MRYWTCAVIFYFQLSRVYPLWQGGHRPLTPDPSPPFHGGEGRIDGFQLGQWRFLRGFAASRETLYKALPALRGERRAAAYRS